MSWFELAAEIQPSLRAGDLVECSERVSGALSELPESPFHLASNLEFTNDPEEIAKHFEKFISLQIQYELGAIYEETNGFDINPDRWFFDVFGYETYRGHNDYNWLSDWQSKKFRSFTLTGMERLQTVYASESFGDRSFRKASGLASLLVVIKFQILIKSSSELIPGLQVPLLATSHDYDFIYEFSPLVELGETSTVSSILGE